MRARSLKRIAKTAFVVCLAFILYLIALNSGAGWLYVVAAVIGAVVIVAAPLPWWNVRGIEAERRADASYGGRAVRVWARVKEHGAPRPAPARGRGPLRRRRGSGRGGTGRAPRA